MSPGIRWLRPDWPAPVHVHAGTTLRQGGVSASPYTSLNLALHVGDEPEDVRQNRLRLQLPAEPCWLEQVHSVDVVEAGKGAMMVPRADAVYSLQPGSVCVVMSADCLPVLLTDKAGTQVAAIHAGWRGLAGGIIENTLRAMGAEASEMLAWLGPAIGPEAYEVGDEVRTVFVDAAAEATTAFSASSPGHWMMDIYTLARQRLRASHVRQIYGGDQCTFRQADDYFSYRRDGATGRMASVIWFEEKSI